MTPICGLVLAGGRGHRMGGIDKGLALFQNRALVAHAIERLRPQVDSVLVSANRNLDRYAAWGCAVVPDRVDGFAGPLAGLDAALHASDAPLLVTVPCDTPFFPLDLVARLAAARAALDADAAVVRTGAQLQAVFALVCRRVRDPLAAFLAGGGRKVELWYATLRTVEVSFDDSPEAFENLNTPVDLARREQP